MQFLHHLFVDVARLALWLALLSAVFVPLERLFALRQSKVWRAGMTVDLGYYFLSSLLPAALLAIPMALFATALHSVMPAAYLTWADQLPPLVRWALALVVAELGTYWGHRWSHEVPMLWRFHAVHHSAEHMDWLANSRAHPVDLVFVRLCGLLPLYALGLVQSSTGQMQSVAFVLVTTVWGFFIHTNVRWRFGALEQIVATPAFHHWHHTRTGAIDRNYATMFPWMDRLFGTLHLPREWPSAYGIERPMPAVLHRQLIEPFRHRREPQTEEP